MSESLCNECNVFNQFQLIHELKEGIDIAAEMRASFSRHVAAALRGAAPDTVPADRSLLRLLRTYDATVTTALQVLIYIIYTPLLNITIAHGY